jgi:hypothetical protein
VRVEQCVKVGKNGATARSLGSPRSEGVEPDGVAHGNGKSNQSV